MDAVDFLTERVRMCNTYHTNKNGYWCKGCPALDEEDRCMQTQPHEAEEAKQVVEIVERWSKEHRKKTNFEKLQELFPNIKFYAIRNCEQVNCAKMGASKCSECEYQDFWSQEYKEPTKTT